MNRLFETAWVIARRDFIATVMSKSFILFLLFPLFIFAFAIVVGELSKQNDLAATQPTVAIVSDSVTAEIIRESQNNFAGSLGAFDVPVFKTIAPETDVPAQIKRLLSSSDENVTAVLSGDLDHPVLTAPQRSLDGLGGTVALIVSDAQRRAALEQAGVQVQAEAVRNVVSGPSAGNLNRARLGVARGGQMLIMMLTFLLANMMLSSMVEERSNKIIEVLSASAPMEAVFLGKLLGMFGACLVGLAVWGSIAGMGMFLMRGAFGGAVDPAVGWVAFTLLTVVYFSINYLLLGAVFLAMGGSSDSMREVQTRMLPATFVQLGVFALASAAVTGKSAAVYWTAVIFPLSSPMAMAAVAAQQGALWPHLLAIVWQLFWVTLIIRVSARMFRTSVMKSGKSEESLFGFLSGLLPSVRR